MWLMENPLAILGIGAAVLVMMFVGLQQTGKRGFLIAMVGVVVLSAGLLLLERWMITPRESVVATLHVLAHDLKSNDVEAVLSHISDRAPKVAEDARSYMRMGTIKEAKIKTIRKVTFPQEKPVRLAVAEFNVVIVGQSGNTGPITIPKILVVYFRDEAGKWRIKDYEVHEVVGQRR